MLRPIPLAVAWLAFATPAFAGNAANLTSQQDARAITIQNRSGTRISQAHVQTTDGRVWDIGKGGVGTNESAEVVVPARDCLANVSARLKGGRELQAVGLHSCDSTKIVVWKNRIAIPHEAIPGAEQYNTPG
ncbi:MAG: hypothetical protein ABI369_10720 [Acetobacteraceae bacterium]